MRTLIGVLLSLLFLLGPAAAEDEKKKPPPKPLTAEQAADAVLEAANAKDGKTLKALSEEDEPDPWLVVDLLCHRGEHAAAAAFAKAAPRASIEKLPEYVASRRGIGPDRKARTTLSRMREAAAQGDWKNVADLAAEVSGAPDSVAKIRVVYGSGIALRALGLPAESTGAMLRAGNAAHKLGWLLKATGAFNQAGNTAFNASAWQEASAAWASRLQVVRELEDKYGIAGALYNIGLAQQRMGDFGKALESHVRALELMETLRYTPGVAAALGDIGIDQQGLGRYVEALSSYRRSLKISEALGAKPRVAARLNDIARINLTLGEYAKALSNYGRSHEMMEALGDHRGIATTLGNMGLVHHSMGDYAEAIRHHRSALEIKERLGDSWGVSNSLANIGLTQQRLGEYDAALSSHRRALQLKKTLGDKRGVAQTLNNIGIVHQSLGADAEALADHLRSLEMMEALGDQQGAAATHCNIAIVYRSLGEYAKAQGEYQRAQQLLEGTPALEARARLLWGLAELQLTTDRPAEAIASAREGVNAASALSEGLAEGSGARARDLFSALFDVGYRAALITGRVTDLLWFLEQGRAGSLRESLGSRAALEAAVIPAKLQRDLGRVRIGERRARAAYQKVRQARSRKSARLAKTAWDTARAEVGRVEARIQREAKAAASVTLAAADDLELIQSRLQAEEALVYLCLTSVETVALIVRRKGARIAALPASKTIEAASDALLDDDQHIDPARVPALQKLLVAPLQLGEDVNRVLVSPMGRLGYVPFGLLLPNREIAYVPSGTTHGLLIEQSVEQGDKVLGLGDPDYRTRVDSTALKTRAGGMSHLTPLPATRKEIETVADVRYLGKEATETGLQEAIKKQQRWRAIHFACHGIIDPQRPMLSALALTADSKSDGYLTALEIFRMKIPADLVVMSACETGKGRIYKTEGIVGLTRAFMFAGAPRVICSLWNVDDEATQALMVEFYRLWNPKSGSKGLGTAAALKEAQAFVRDHRDKDGKQHWKHPQYWAAWVLWGLPD